MMRVAVLLSLCLTSVHGWTTPSSNSRSVSRQDFVKTAGFAASAWFLSPSLPAMAADDTLPNGIKYEVKKTGTGPKPVIGELIAIRFSAYAGDNKIDDIFGTPEPYYTRLGSSNLIKGVEETLPLMRVGDRWLLTIPGELAFGKKGRPASAGKPRIPADQTIVFELEVEGLPGRETELIELIGDE